MSSTPTSVTKSITVELPVAAAFTLFTSEIDRWWHRELTGGEGKLLDIVFEPRVGGRMYNQTEKDFFQWGEVLEVDAPNRIFVAWGLNTSYTYEADVTKSSRLEIRFEAVGPDQTEVTVAQWDVDKLGPAWEAMLERMKHDVTGWGGLLQAYARVAASRPASYWAQFAK